MAKQHLTFRIDSGLLEEIDSIRPRNNPDMNRTQKVTALLKSAVLERKNRLVSVAQPDTE